MLHLPPFNNYTDCFPHNYVGADVKTIMHILQILVYLRTFYVFRIFLPS